MKTTTVYRGPGYPVDPEKEEGRQLSAGLEAGYQCVMESVTPPTELHSETVVVQFDPATGIEMLVAYDRDGNSRVIDERLPQQFDPSLPAGVDRRRWLSQGPHADFYAAGAWAGVEARLRSERPNSVFDEYCG